MNDHVGTVYLEWSTTRSGVVIHDGRKSRHVSIADVPSAVGRSTEVIVVRHVDGPGLAVAALSAVINGRAAEARVESDIGHRTKIIGTAITTLATWVNRSPIGHPAAKVMAYTRGDPESMAAVIGNIFDPKWFVDTDRPDRRSAVEARFGLTPRWDDGDSTFRSCLTRAWFGRRQPGWEPTDHDFFGRMYLVKSAEKGPTVAERIVGRYFLKCLLAAWSDADRPLGSEPMFDTGILFDARANAAVGPRN